MSLLRRRQLRIKVCSGCGGVKLVKEFYKNRFNDDALDNYCKLCRLDYNSEWSAQHRDRRYLINWRYRNKRQKINAMRSKSDFF